MRNIDNRERESVPRTRLSKCGRQRALAAIYLFLVYLSGCGSGDAGAPIGGSNAKSPARIREATDLPLAAGTGYIFRFAKISSGAYFYTGWPDERDRILQSYPDFRYEGIAFLQTTTRGASSVYRFANLRNGGYFYTASQAERDFVIQTRPDMRYEGTSFSVALPSQSDTDPVYRLANLQNGAYLYTSDPNERALAISLGIWRDEGIAFYVATEKAPSNASRCFNAKLFEPGATQVSSWRRYVSGTDQPSPPGYDYRERSEISGPVGVSDTRHLMMTITTDFEDRQTTISTVNFSLEGPVVVTYPVNNPTLWNFGLKVNESVSYYLPNPPPFLSTSLTFLGFEDTSTPAGEFRGACRFTWEGFFGGPRIDRWYAQGSGVKIREVSGSADYRLVSASLNDVRVSPD